MGSSFLTGDRTPAPCIGSAVLATGLPAKSQGHIFKTQVLILKGKVLSLKAVQKSKYSSFPLMKIKVWKANYSEHYSKRVNEAISGSEDTKPRMV